MRFVVTNGLPILIEDNDYIIRINLPTPQRAKLPNGWFIKGGSRTILRTTRKIFKVIEKKVDKLNKV